MVVLIVVNVDVSKLFLTVENNFHCVPVSIEIVVHQIYGDVININSVT